MVLFFGLFIVGWVWLGFTGARELFPDLQARLASYGDHVPRILRVCLAWILLSSAFGAEPRYSVEPFTSPTFLAPDLELSLLGPEWQWLGWAEIFLGLTILFGIYVRLFAALLIGLTLLGGILFGSAIMAYAGAMIGACIYLVLQGPGRHYLPLPILPSLRGIQSWLAGQPRQRAQAIMRILTGTTLLYLGVFFKFMQPNLSIGIINTYDLPLLTLDPEAFTLFMALVEASAGILMMAGVLLRPLSFFLIAAFSMFALLLPETPTEHILFYGVVLTCLINSAGHLRRPEPRDKPASIVIVGGGLAALQAASKVEKLIGQYSNVVVTLLNDQANFVFTPFLPEVVGGTVQPGNVVNPFRRIIQQTQVVVGHFVAVDEQKQAVIAKRKNNEVVEIPYDTLVLAPVAQSSRSEIPGMTAHACPFDTVTDALKIRQRVLDLVEEAEFSADPAEQERLLTFAVIGSGEFADTIAIELSEILRAAEPSYAILGSARWRIDLYREPSSNGTDFEAKIADKRKQGLDKAGVAEHSDLTIERVTEKRLLFTSGEARPVGLVVNTKAVMPDIQFSERGLLASPLPIDDELKLEGSDNVFVAQFNGRNEGGQFLLTSDFGDLGAKAGFNAWACSQGYPFKPFEKSEHYIMPYNMSIHSVCLVKDKVFSGNWAWFVSRLVNLFSVPGLERNLRIIIDWFLLIAFRNDIAVLAPASSEKLQKAYFKAGDTIYKQGDAASLAYVVDAGRLKIQQGKRKVRELGPGDYFGEILPTHSNKRIETVECLTDCELRQVAQEDLKALIQSGWLMSKAIRNLSDYSAQVSAPVQGMKRLTYISKLNAVMSSQEILELGRLASMNNRTIDVTGVLISAGEYFFQILEGEPETVNRLVEKISRDPRHCDVTILSVENACEERLFTDWNMKTVALTESTDLMLQAVGIMLQNIAQSYHIIGRYTQPALLKYLTEGINPLSVPTRKFERIAVGGVMPHFAALSQDNDFDQALEILNSFLEICSSTFIEFGGQVARYSRSGVIAHFPPDQVGTAIAACERVREKLREWARDDAIQIDRFGFGIVKGPMIEGNIGSSIKMDYTVMGGKIEEAGFLAALAQDLDTALLVDQDIESQAGITWDLTLVGEFECEQSKRSIKAYALS